jgi:hypothetical protein
LKNLQKSSHPNLYLLRRKRQTKRRGKVCTCNEKEMKEKGKEKAPKKEPERMISAGGVMNE